MIESTKKERNTSLDLIRFSGVLAIMVAHSSPPGWLFQFRNFDVTLLILGSALTYAYIYETRTIDTGSFLRKRLKKLVLPAWIFLTFFFLFVYIVLRIIGVDFPFSGYDILESYAFYEGIGFVWIFKVFIILALITPVGIKWSKSSISNIKYFGGIIAVYLIYEIAVCLLFVHVPIAFKEFVANVILVIIPYTVLYLYGLRIRTLSNRQLCYIIFTSLVVFLILAIDKWRIFDGFVPTQGYKYPPTLYYLSYGFCCANLFYYIVVNHLKVKHERFKAIMIWLSTNSLWIYLWHILAIYIWRFTIEGRFDVNAYMLLHFMAKFLFLLGFGIVLTIMQIGLINKVWNKSSPSMKVFLALLR